MPRDQFEDVILDRTGELVTTCTITVYVAPPYTSRPLTVLADIFSAETGLSTPGNSFNAEDGRISFWADPGSYDIRISDSGFPARFADRVVRWNSIPGDEGIVLEMVGDESIDRTKIIPGSVESQHIVSGGVTSENIEDGTIRFEDLSAAVVQQYLFNPGDLRITSVPTRPPEGWLATNGNYVRVADYPDLFDAIGHYYSGGVDPGSGLFRLPQYDGLALVGTGTNSNIPTSNRELGDVWGSETVRLSANQMPSEVAHHDGGPLGNRLTTFAADGAGLALPAVAPPRGWVSGSNQSVSITQPSAAIHVWIKT